MPPRRGLASERRIKRTWRRIKARQEHAASILRLCTKLDETLMRHLPWLTESERQAFYRRLDETVSQEICHRHWGARAPGPSPSNVRRWYIMDIRGLFLAAGVLRYTLAQYQTSVLYRGQRRDWEIQVPLFRGATRRAQAKSRAAWLDTVLSEIRSVFDPAGSTEEREALAQHYGLPTRWLDLVDNVQTAAWFAYHSSSTGDRDDSTGYIYALAHPTTSGSFTHAYDLRVKPSEWLRPHIQQAWAIRAAKPDVGLGRLSYMQVATFIVPRALLASWCGYSVFTAEVMFPNENEDRGAYYWGRAQGVLSSRGLYPPPWLTPTP